MDHVTLPSCCKETSWLLWAFSSEFFWGRFEDIKPNLVVKKEILGFLGTELANRVLYQCQIVCFRGPFEGSSFLCLCNVIIAILLIWLWPRNAPIFRNFFTFITNIWFLYLSSIIQYLDIGILLYLIQLCTLLGLDHVLYINLCRYNTWYRPT